MSTVIDKFFDKIIYSNETECHLWNAAIGRTGYGRFQVKGKGIYAHRFSYIFWIGLIPEGMCVLHKCDNRSCVNPNHLFLGTYKDNTKDMFNKGRQHLTDGTRNGMAKLTLEQVNKIRNDRRKQRIIAEDYNISTAQVSRIKTNKRWSSK